MNKSEFYTFIVVLISVAVGIVGIVAVVAANHSAEPTNPFADVATNGWRLARIATEPIDGGVRLTLDLMEDEK